MDLATELGLRCGFDDRAHEGILNIYYTGILISKRARHFFARYNITDVQFNVLRLLHFQEEGGGLTQGDLSRMMIVHRSNITGIVDRMEKAGFVRRASVPGDRRCNAVQLTPRGRKLFLDVESTYQREIAEVMDALSAREVDQLISMLERLRRRVR